MGTPVHSVALNALFLAPGDSGGPETYTRELVGALATEYPSLRLTLFTTGSGRRALAADGFGDLVDLRALPTEEYRRARRLAAEQLLFPLAARRSGAQIAHSLASVAPVVTPGLRTVITLHDVTFLRMATFGRATTFVMRELVTRAARRADALVTAAAAARDEICMLLGLDPDRFSIVPHGVGSVPRAQPAATEDVRARLDLNGQRVVLCVAALRPHKNQELLVRALPSLPEDVLLVLAGRREPYADRLLRMAGELGVSERVRLPGYLSDAELEGLWSIASCAAFPTRGEGFGLPVVEAMARRVPVACSDIPVLREVGAGVPRYFPTDDPTATATAVRAALDDGSDGQRGVERATSFSWADAAHGTMEAYERALIADRS